MRLALYVITTTLVLNQNFIFTEEKETSPQQSISITPIRALVSSGAPKSSVWVHATVINIDEEDTPIIQDKTGKILLFLPTDELLDLNLTVGSEIYVLGKVDVSSVHPSKNELYADRIIFAEKKPKEGS